MCNPFKKTIIKRVEKQAQILLPTEHGEFEVMAYANLVDEPMPHLVLINPKTDFSRAVNVRIHSECMTGDVFRSYRCECGEQLSLSLDYVNKHGGVVIYLRQEGRGIGLINKMHAYVKQDQGYDTADANKMLGFGYDDRTYEDAVVILEDLDVKEINLITNNPDKINALENSGIHVLKRIDLDIKARKENIGYLTTKKEKFGHELNL